MPLDLMTAALAAKIAGTSGGGDGGGSGGGGSDIDDLIFPVSYTETSTNVWSCSKTYAEITQAYSAGKLILADISGIDVTFHATQIGVMLFMGVVYAFSAVVGGNMMSFVLMHNRSDRITFSSDTSEIQGVPAGGSENQVLSKVSDADGAVQWSDPMAPPGGAQGQVLMKYSDSDFDASWADPPVPSGGLQNQVLMKNSDSDQDASWSDVPGPDPAVVRSIQFMDGYMTVTDSDGNNYGFDIGTGIAPVHWGEEASLVFLKLGEGLLTRAFATPGTPVSISVRPDFESLEKLLNATLFAMFSGYPVWVISDQVTAIAAPVTSMSIVGDTVLSCSGNVTGLYILNDNKYLVRFDFTVARSGYSVGTMVAYPAEETEIPTVHTSTEVMHWIKLSVEGVDPDEMAEHFRLETSFPAPYVDGSFGEGVFDMEPTTIYSETEADYRTSYDGRSYLARIAIYTDSETGDPYVEVPYINLEVN